MSQLQQHAEKPVAATQYLLQRIITIAKRMKQLDESESTGENKYDYENIIEAMEDLIKKNALNHG